jgi:hypothetical protein
MIFVSNAVINYRAMVIKSFNTPHTSHAMDRALRPNTPTEETEVVQIPILLQSFVQVLIEFCNLYRFSISRIFTESDKKHYETE